MSARSVEVTSLTWARTLEQSYRDVRALSTSDPRGKLPSAILPVDCSIFEINLDLCQGPGLWRRGAA